MKRSEKREHVFLMLFQREFFQQEDLEEQCENYFDNIENIVECLMEEKKTLGEEGSMSMPSEKAKRKLKERYFQIIDKLPEIDKIIEEVSSGWRINRMGKVDLALLRLAVFELYFDEEIPTGVAINEAVELAKAYGQDSSPSFVNGILAKAVKAKGTENE